MFVCLEVYSEDITIWKAVDKVMAEELGLVRGVWGQSEGKAHFAKLPETIFYTELSEDELKFLRIIKEKLSTIKASIHIVVIGKSWAIGSCIYTPEEPEESSVILDEQESEIICREE
jgi:hypothetical protein